MPIVQAVALADIIELIPCNANSGRTLTSQFGQPVSSIGLFGKDAARQFD
ncbi:MAG: hypothetical protein ACI8P0_004009 [Planctomycetaceae bacterium]|jgi:hypothetical protein